jgi:LPXTG-motif cell wall-anchored protein
MMSKFITSGVDMKRLFSLCSAIAIIVGAFAMSTSAQAVTPQQDFTESDTFVVPSGVTEIQTVLIGGHGVGGDCDSPYDGNGGAGARITATIPVTPGDTLHIHINSDGGDGGGAGGRGGHSTDIRIGGDTLADRVLVAGGGGGGGCAGSGGATMEGGDGGNATAVAENGSDGFAVEEPPEPPSESSSTTTTTEEPISPPSDLPSRGLGGGAGTLIDVGMGGLGTFPGSDGGNPNDNNGGASQNSDAPGGGGGAGYFGGGAGASETDESGSGGGGGGAGSSYATEEATSVSIISNEDAAQEVELFYSAEETTTTAPAPSGAYGESGSTTSLSSTPGGTITVHGDGFGPDTDVTVTLHSAPMLLGTAHTNSSGSFVKTFTIPSGATLGAHTVVLSGVDANGDPATTTLALTLTNLPTTGANFQTTVMIALGLMVFGAALALRKKKKLFS